MKINKKIEIFVFTCICLFLSYLLCPLQNKSDYDNHIGKRDFFCSMPLYIYIFAAFIFVLFIK